MCSARKPATSSCEYFRPSHFYTEYLFQQRQKVSFIATFSGYQIGQVNVLLAFNLFLTEGNARLSTYESFKMYISTTGLGELSKLAYKSSTLSQVCITVSKSPNPSLTLCKTRNKLSVA